MPKDYISIGSSPSEEDCAQVGSDNYQVKACFECAIYIRQLFRHLASLGHTEETLPESFNIVTKSFPHDFGSYHEVCAIFNNEDEKAVDIAFLLENDGPSRWDDQARAELINAGYLKEEDL